MHVTLDVPVGTRPESVYDAAVYIWPAVARLTIRLQDNTALPELLAHFAARGWTANRCCEDDTGRVEARSGRPIDIVPR